MLELLTRPWPWYVAGPLIGAFVPLLLWLGNRLFGVSSNLRHLCAATLPSRCDYFTYEWRRDGRWNLTFAAGTIIGGFIAGAVLANPQPVAIAEATVADLRALGVSEFSGLVPADIFTWSALGSLRGFLLLVVGGFLIGFGTAYAGGCTSGHGLSGIADLQIASFVALIAFFTGGILATFFLLPRIL